MGLMQGQGKENLICLRGVGPSVFCVGGPPLSKRGGAPRCARPGGGAEKFRSIAKLDRSTCSGNGEHRDAASARGTRAIRVARSSDAVTSLSRVDKAGEARGAGVSRGGVSPCRTGSHGVGASEAAVELSNRYRVLAVLHEGQGHAPSQDGGCEDGRAGQPHLNEDPGGAQPVYERAEVSAFVAEVEVSCEMRGDETHGMDGQGATGDTGQCGLARRLDGGDEALTQPVTGLQALARGETDVGHIATGFSGGGRGGRPGWLDERFPPGGELQRPEVGAGCGYDGTVVAGHTGTRRLDLDCGGSPGRIAAHLDTPQGGVGGGGRLGEESPAQGKIRRVAFSSWEEIIGPPPVGSACRGGGSSSPLIGPRVKPWRGAAELSASALRRGGQNRVPLFRGTAAPASGSGTATFTEPLNCEVCARGVAAAIGVADRAPRASEHHRVSRFGTTAAVRALRNAWAEWRDLEGSSEGDKAADPEQEGRAVGGQPTGSEAERRAAPARKPALRRRPREGARHSHARYIQRMYRKAVGLGCWARGALRPAARELAAARRLWAPRCAGGKNLAEEHEFEAQRARSGLVLGWYSLYVDILRRLMHGVTPGVVEGFCGGGGTSEGTRRAGGVSHGIDHQVQDDFIRRFGAGAFTEGDAADYSVVRAVAKRTGAVGGFASPPCQAYSTAATHTEHPALIPRVRDMLRQVFRYWSIENVAGAKKAMSSSTVEMRGAMFGLRVVRPRLFESNFMLHVDEFLRVPAAALESRCCLGERRRWKRYDEYGRPRAPCCSGNVFSPLGVAPWRCTAAQCASAMGVDERHMSYERLAQSVPPAYANLRFSQMCMAMAHEEFGVPVITYDEMLRRPHAARRELYMWLRGAGDASPAAGLVFTRDASGGPATSVAAIVPLTTPAGSEWSSGSRGYDEAAEASHREFFYSHAGGYDRCWSEGYAKGAWLAPLAQYQHVGERVTGDGGAVDVPRRCDFESHNTYVDVGARRLEAAWPEMHAAMAAGSGTRLSVRVDVSRVSIWLKRGFAVLEWEEAYREGDGQSAAVRARPLMWAGRRRSAMGAAKLVHAEVLEYMDPRDQTGWKPDPEEKSAFIFSPMGVDVEAWASASEMPADVRRLMTVGAEPGLMFELDKREIPQYRLVSEEGRRECIWECDRAMAVGHLELVPDDEVASVKVIHPWQVALKEGKARACQDYSAGVNPATFSKPFGLPTAWDVKRDMHDDTHFAKRDLRDGFWAVPVAESCRNLFVLRHPATQRLVRATSLPFGWTDSPRLFCSVTEAIAGEFRRRASDQGLSCAIHCFVDDFLLQGRGRSTTQTGIDLLDDVMADLGLFWAPHKERGPARVMEFLGLLLVNVPGLQCVGLTARRQTSVLARLDSWLDSRVAAASPVDLAVLLGHLVFASQVVPGGRTYMQGMLSQMKGLEVDWARGAVRATRGGRGSEAWRPVELGGAFWRDVEWWREALETRNCVTLDVPPLATAAIAGTDASDWGTGQLVLLNGGREELQLRFTAAERRRTINWRELLGIVRILEMYGERFAGMVVLVEGDNTASIGAASKWSSKSPGMQELVRRLFDVCEKWGVRPRFCHTPGVMLHRPDQTSRGDLVEEPRARFNAPTFAMLERKFGNFTEFLGGEREHRRGTVGEDAPTLVWVHPTYTTVGSALRRLGERSVEEGGSQLRAVVVVPDEPRAAWRAMLKHFKVEGCFGVGGAHIEMCQMGQWRSAESRRGSLILSFPRAGSAGVTRVWLGGGQARILLRGTIVYSPGRGQGRGELLIVLKNFDVSQEDVQHLGNGMPTVLCAELLLVEDSYGAAPREQVYEIGFVGEGRRRGGSFYRNPAGDYHGWDMSASLLWEVGHLVKTKEIGSRASVASLGRGAEQCLAETGSMAARQYQFDCVQADQAIRRVKRGARKQRSLARPDPLSDAEVTPEVSRKPRAQRVVRMRPDSEIAMAAELGVEPRLGVDVERSGVNVERRRSSRATQPMDRFSETVFATPGIRPHAPYPSLAEPPPHGVTTDELGRWRQRFDAQHSIYARAAAPVRSPSEEGSSTGTSVGCTLPTAGDGRDGSELMGAGDETAVEALAAGVDAARLAVASRRRRGDGDTAPVLVAAGGYIEERTPAGCEVCCRSDTGPPIAPFCLECSGCLPCKCTRLWYVPACACDRTDRTGWKELGGLLDLPPTSTQVFFCQTCPGREVMWCTVCEGCHACSGCNVAWFLPSCVCQEPATADGCTLLLPEGAARNPAFEAGDSIGLRCICNKQECVCGLGRGGALSDAEMRAGGHIAAADFVARVDADERRSAAQLKVRAMPVVQLTGRRRSAALRKSSVPVQPRAPPGPPEGVSARGDSGARVGQGISPAGTCVRPTGAATEGPVLVCVSSAVSCIGCRSPIGMGSRMRSLGARLTHDNDRCYAEGKLRLAAWSRPSSGVSTTPSGRGAGAGPSAQVEKIPTRKETVLLARVDSERVRLALQCLAGECGVEHPRMTCAGGCGRGAHGRCLGVAKSYSDLGQLRCAWCRAQDMTGGGEPTLELLRSATKSMLWELTVGSHSTAKGYGEYQRLERQWVESTKCDKVELPRDSAESMVAFLVWLAADSGRARSFTTIWRAASGVCAKTRENSMTKSARVLRVYDDVVKAIGELGVPCTQATRRLIDIMLGLTMGHATLMSSCMGSRGSEMILARSQVLLVLECMCGLRVGEGTGDNHGLLANDVAIVTPMGDVCRDMGVTIEGRITSAKTGPGRFVNCVGTSRVSGVPVESFLRELFTVSKFKMRVTHDGGFMLEKPDYMVLRVSLLSMSGKVVEIFNRALERELTSPTCEFVAKHARQSIKYVAMRIKALDISEEKRYVNIAGGYTGEPGLLEARDWAKKVGLERYTSFMAGPLLRATEPGSGSVTHMPLQEGSTYTHHVGALRKAYEISSGMDEPDLELELNGEEPQFANHSLRRFADRVARETAARSGASDMDIDIMFGWNEAQRKKDMQLHYQGLDRAQRVQRARVTMYL